MTKPQTKLYWQAWAAAKRAARLEDHDRHALHERTLGYPRSSTHLTNAEFDKILATFRALSHPSNLNAQIRQIEQPRTRLLRAIRHQLRALALFKNDPGAYLDTILRERFSVQDAQDISADIYERPRARASQAGPAGEIISSSALADLRKTLHARLSNLRRNWNTWIERHGPTYAQHQVPLHSPLTTHHQPLSEHALCHLAKIPCFRPACAACRDLPSKPQEAPVGPVPDRAPCEALDGTAIAAGPPASQPCINIAREECEPDALRDLECEAPSSIDCGGGSRRSTAPASHPEPSNNPF